MTESQLNDLTLPSLSPYASKIPSGERPAAQKIEIRHPDWRGFAQLSEKEIVFPTLGEDAGQYEFFNGTRDLIVDWRSFDKAHFILRNDIYFHESLIPDIDKHWLLSDSVEIVHPDWRGALRISADGSSVLYPAKLKGRCKLSNDKSVIVMKNEDRPEERFLLKAGLYFHESMLFDGLINRYLKGHQTSKLEIGCGENAKDGWFSTDLFPRIGSNDLPVARLNVSKNFPIVSETFDFIYSEHMIEHVSFSCGQNMLRECYRILKVGGKVRIATPSIGFLLRVISADCSAIEDTYKSWSVNTFVCEAPKVTSAFFLNNYFRNWGHVFIYDRETFRLALEMAGFQDVKECSINRSESEELQGLEDVERMPPGFLEIESMIFEASKL
jgi:predicted SAM-dependent methyltransferase